MEAEDNYEEKWSISVFSKDSRQTEQEKQKILRVQLRNKLGKQIDGRRPMKVLVIGSSGVGKSCFCNSMITALLDCNAASTHIEYFTSGSYDGTKSVTVRLDRFAGHDYVNEINVNQDICWPTIFDMRGFENENTELLREITLLIVNGYIPNNCDITEVLGYGKNNGLEALREKYSTYDESMRIDRIIFVASAAKNEALPLKLMKCVIAVAQPDKPHRSYVTRTIPLFGMLTKIDTVDTSEEKFRNKEVAFRRGLGIYGSTRYGCCSTYCSGIYQPGEEIGSILPRLNVPILKFLIAVFSPSATEVVSQCEPPMTSTESQTEQQIVEKQTLEFPSYLIRTAIRLLAFAVFIGVCIIYSPVLPKNVRRECGMMTKNENITEINKICEASINNEIAFITYTSVYQMLAIALYILFELIFELLLYLF